MHNTKLQFRISPAISENKIENTWYLRISFAIFLLLAAGSIISEFISKIPIHLIESITIIEIVITKILSINITFIPLLLAKLSLILIVWSLLKIRFQTINVAAKAIAKYIISILEIAFISPTK